MDAAEYSSVEELLALARGKEGWAARVKQIDPADHTTAASVVASLLDASAKEWRKGAEIYVWWEVYRVNINLIETSRSRSATLIN